MPCHYTGILPRSLSARNQSIGEKQSYVSEMPAEHQSTDKLSFPDEGQPKAFPFLVHIDKLLSKTQLPVSRLGRPIR